MSKLFSFFSSRGQIQNQIRHDNDRSGSGKKIQLRADIQIRIRNTALIIILCTPTQIIEFIADLVGWTQRGVGRGKLQIKNLAKM